MNTDKTLTAITCLCAGMALAVTCDTISKYLSSGYAIHEVNAIRYMVTLPIALAIVWPKRGLLRLNLGSTLLLLLRGLLIGFANLLFMLGAAKIPLADGVAIYFTMPFFVAGIVPFMIGERVPSIRWAFIAIGFLGVLIMTRPGSSAFDIEMLYPLGCAFFYGLGQVLTRKLDREIPSAVTSFWQSIVFTGFYSALALAIFVLSPGVTGNKSIDFLVRGWSIPNGYDFCLIISAGLLSSAQLPLVVYAYKHAPASLVAPFEYTAMLWAILWGLFVFGDVPDAATFVGAVIVIIAGIGMVKFDRVTPKAPSLSAP
jgi:drug/metabolite transporter (DMT)-like permease